MHFRGIRSSVWLALACGAALVLPATSVAAPASVSGPASIPENAGKATYTVDCGTTPAVIPGPEVPNVGTLTVTVTEGPAPAAKQGDDFGEPSATTIPCSLGGTVEVPIVDDALDEPGERYTVRITGTLAAPLGNPPNPAIDASFTTAIADDDVPDMSIIELVRVLEGGTAQLTVSLSQVPAEAVTINYATENGSAVAGSDFRASSGQLAIPPGSQTGTISVPLLDDGAVEKAEGFYVNLSSPVNATLNPARTQAAIAVFDNDRAPVPAFSLPKGVAVREGDGGTVNVLFTVTLSGAAAERVQVAWRTANFTANLADYAAGKGTLVFEPGQTTKTISVNVKGDRRDEPDEAFGVVLEKPVGGTLGAAKSFGVITDDDGPAMTIGRPKLRPRALVLALACPPSADICRGRLTAAAGKLSFGAAAFEIAKGNGGRLKLKLPRKARAALRKRARRVRFTLTASDRSGAERITTRTFRIRRLR
jgi:hypothetical protein